MKKYNFLVFTGVLAVVFLFIIVVPARAGDDDLKNQIEEMKKVMDQLVQKNQELADEIGEIKSKLQTILGDLDNETRQKAYRVHFNKRYARDKKIYSFEQLSEASSLYQVANRENSKKAIRNLKKVIEKYPLSNRAGCAALYLGQRLKDQESVHYLNLAIENYDDCYYGDGVRVGAYARYILGRHYESTGAKDEASKLYQEIRAKYSGAIDHKGGLLIDSL